MLLIVGRKDERHVVHFAIRVRNQAVNIALDPLEKFVNSKTTTLMLLGVGSVQVFHFV